MQVVIDYIMRLSFNTTVGCLDKLKEKIIYAGYKAFNVGNYSYIKHKSN